MSSDLLPCLISNPTWVDFLGRGKLLQIKGSETTLLWQLKLVQNPIMK